MSQSRLSDSISPAAAKRALRAEIQRALAGDADASRFAAMSAADLAEHGARVSAVVQEIATVRGVRQVAIYAALPGEMPLRPLCAWLEERGGLVMPRVSEAGLVLHAVVSIADLRPGVLGILEPVPEAAPVEPEALELILVPGLLFDRRGGRLGRGKGHYDRLLARLAPGCTKLGVTPEARIVPALPLEAHDIRMDALVTERGHRDLERTRPEPPTR
jgi:5-formyltetrahydrofolate cyclo-ligase